MDWNPHTLAHCLDSIWAARIEVALCLGIIVNYYLINRVWSRALKNSHKNARTIFGALRGIFLLCAAGGYLSRIISVWQPEIAYFVAVGAMTLDNILCFIFLSKAPQYNFASIGKEQKIGKEVMDRVTVKRIPESELREITEIVISEVLERELLGKDEK